MKPFLPELLAPAGDLEKLKVALEFGADAVYFGLPDFSLRARINQFDLESIEQGAKICRQQGKKFYLTLNIYAHNEHIKKLPEYLKFIKSTNPDALIVADPGILRLVRKELPQMPIHISTQANVTNVQAVKFWQEQGVSRIILAREVTLDEIKEIKKAVPTMELEYFVHGAMCMSYSGRCILSKWMTGRSANLGDCAQPCRWKYHQTGKQTGNSQPADDKALTGRQETESLEQRSNPLKVVDDQDRFEMKIEEDQQGTYFFNSYDICLIEYLDELQKAGVDSFKIEGRAKSVYYLATVVRAYRKVIDAVSLAGTQNDRQADERRKIVLEQKTELEKLSNRGYWTGFLLGTEPPHLFDKDARREKEWMFCGVSKEKINSPKRQVLVHNFFSLGDEIEIVTPKENRLVNVLKIVDSKQQELQTAHGGQGQIFELTFSDSIEGIFLMRKKT